MKKIKAVVSGTIQNVGYRAKVIGFAKLFDLTGFVQNLDNGRVKIIAEGYENNLNTFLGVIRIKNALIDVDDIEVEYADATGDFDDFCKLVGGGETDERLDKAAEYLKKLIDVTENGFAAVTAEMRTGFENLDSKMDVMIEKQDAMLEKQNETTAEIRGLREDMKTYMDRKFGEIESELDIIKSALKGSGILC
ncbi:MAG: acylphosphatase [Methanosarcinales archaeon]|nr:acylphosphatase [Methanosarcinales archaeon]